MHLRSSALSITFILCSIVRSVDGTPVPPDSSRAGGSYLPNQRDVAHVLEPRGPTSTDYTMKIGTGGHAVLRPSTRDSFVELGNKILSHWGMVRDGSIEVWPNDVSELDGDLDQLFNYFEIEAVYGHPIEDTQCPNGIPCIGRFHCIGRRSCSFVVQSQFTWEQATFPYRLPDLPALWIQVGDGCQTVHLEFAAEFNALFKLVLHTWDELAVVRVPSPKLMNAASKWHAARFHHTSELDISLVGSYRSESCPPEHPCTGKYRVDDDSWTITSSTKGLTMKVTGRELRKMLHNREYHIGSSS
ncbi:hypothetical protein FB446DRAFT_742523 [Lentinula raphanica]|nr:hypothetical protein FB446DRAFT_742523 [Lentinula raphanica]